MNRLAIAFCIVVYSALVDLARWLLLPFYSRIGRGKNWYLDKRIVMPHMVRERRCRTTVWLHAASLGEAKLLPQFHDVIQQQNPDDCYVVTAVSKAGVDFLEAADRPSILAVGFLPFDTLGLMRKLIREFNVTRLWLLETELWPSMLMACHRAGIPVGIANARMEEKSFVNYRRFRPVFKILLEGLDIVLVQNDVYRSRFLALGVAPGRIHIVGNMKAHISFGRPSPSAKRALRKRMSLSDGDFVITAGCLHPGEGPVIAECLAILAKRGRRCRCIVVPRHLDKAETVAAELGPETLMLSECETTEPWDVCVVNKLGILESMYKLADAGIVGGTFVPVGGHNVWEVAQFLIPVFFGPHFHSQTSSCEKLLGSGVGFTVKNGTELAGCLEQTLWAAPEKFAAKVSFFADDISRQQRVQEPLIP
jgi:3-deoxy-D-manno-octulosonic-acid transferase